MNITKNVLHSVKPYGIFFCIIASVRHWLWSDMLWAELSIVPVWNRPQRIEIETCSPKSLIYNGYHQKQTSANVVSGCSLWSSYPPPSSPAFPFSNPDDAEKRLGLSLNSPRASDCGCCCEWSLATLGKMKPLVADKLVVSLGVEREEDVTALFSSVLRNLGGKGGLLRYG